MSSNFPYSPDTFSDKIDNVDIMRAEDVNNIQDCVVRIENSLNAIIKGDPDLLTLCHFEGKTSGYRNFEAAESGAVRYLSGKYGESVYIERGAVNYVKNPALRSSGDLWSFTATTGSMSGSRVTSDFPPGIKTGGCYKIRVESAGDAAGTVKTEMTGLAPDSVYTISFWTKNSVSSGNFTGVEMKIADGEGLGAAGPAYSVSSSWSRVAGTYTTGQSQNTFFLEVKFSKTGAAAGDEILFGGFQVESGSSVSTYCDGSQGSGYEWTGDDDSSNSLRNGTVIQYPTSSSLDKDTGSIGFLVKPDWGNSDSAARYFFDTTFSSSNKRFSIFKDGDNKLNFRVSEPGGDILRKTDSAVDWEPSGGWLHIACTYDFQSSWDLQIYVNGEEPASSQVGITATSSPVGNYMYPGCSQDLSNYSNSRFDDFFIYKKVLSPVEISKIYDSPVQITEGILRATSGYASTSGTPGDSSSVAHGLGETPSFVEITPRSQYIVYLSESDSSDNLNFYVKSTGANAGFYWRAWK